MARTRWFFLLCALVAGLMTVCGCIKSPGSKSGDGKLMVGMVTNATTIDDKSFNQGTWEGLKQAGHDFQLKVKYLRPNGSTTADFAREFANLHDAGYRLIMAPGFKFANAIYAAQLRYPDAQFVLIDSLPSSADNPGKSGVAANSVAIFFAEHEAGFLAGLAAAIEIGSGQFGFIGGMEIPPVQKFNWGFQQGIKYANAHFGTTIGLRPENVIYQGTFSDVAAGQQLAAHMYDKGVSVIFAAAGAVGAGVINESASRAKTGKSVWVVGVDVDQYSQGFYDRAGMKSVVITSAMKYIHQAAYDMVKHAATGTFPGGRVLVYDAKNKGVGLPVNNPNLSPDTLSKVRVVTAQLSQGEIAVSDKGEGLIK